MSNARHVYVISVAAELAGMHPQTLRMYERRGLVRPGRTAGNARRYSDADVTLLGRIQALTEEGLNLAGIERVLDLESRLAAAERRARDLEAELRAAEVSARAERDALRRSLRAEIVVVSGGGPPAERVEPIIPRRHARWP
ncbi:MAG: MerR family transcriptional regulator [Actinobacteria bacterium]|nr:MerR family transcriptional regulator [Actinomycetota bacterium]